MGGAGARRKGVEGERQVAQLFEQAGWTLRGLEGQGDWLAFAPVRSPASEYGPSLHLEVKRAERLKLPEWLRQAADEAPPGVAPVVVFRQNRGLWYACLPLDDLLGLLR